MSQGPEEGNHLPLSLELNEGLSDVRFPDPTRRRDGPRRWLQNMMDPRALARWEKQLMLSHLPVLFIHHSFGSYPSGRLQEERAYTRGHLTASASPRLLVHIYQEPMSQALPDARAGETLRGRFPGPSLKEGMWVSISQMKKHGASRG